jgi:hypothetical protein
MSSHTTAALVLAFVYAVSAAQKARYLRPFREYIRPLAGRYSGIAARGVVGTEVLLLIFLMLSTVQKSLSSKAGASSVSFLTAAVLSYSALIARGQSTECHCFGKLPRAGRLKPAMRPAFFALRSYVLLMLSFGIAGAEGLAAATISAGVVMLLCAGLLVSIVRERLLLKRNPHPRVHHFAGRVARLQVHSWWVNGHPRAW